MDICTSKNIYKKMQLDVEVSPSASATMIHLNQYTGKTWCGEIITLA